MATTFPPHNNPLSLSSLTNAFSPLFHLPKLPSVGPTKTTIIRMGGGPRTYPGGVSKWQWKRMQANKAKQLLKARLLRERQIYEMRKRAELKAAVSQLERPWEVIEDNTGSGGSSSTALFSVSADEQLKVLADRFQKPGGFDLWSQNDGPQLFYHTPHDGLPSSRFFPKGVVHSVKPYGVGGVDGGDEDFGVDDEEMVLGFGNSRRKRGDLRGRGEFGVGGIDGGDGGFGVDDEEMELGTGNARQKGRNLRGRGKLGDDGEEGEEYVFGNLRGRRKGEGLGYLGSSEVSSRVKGYGKMGNRGFIDGRNEGLDGVGKRGGSEDHNVRGGRKSRNGGSRIGRGGGESRTLAERGRGSGSGRSLSGRMGNGSFVGGGNVEGFYGDGEMEGSGVHNMRGGRNGRNRIGQGGGSRNLEERGSGRSSSGRLGNNGSFVGGDHVKSRRKGIEEQNSEYKYMGSERKQNAQHRNRMNGGSDRRLSIRGRNSGKSRSSKHEDIFDMSMQHDGSYGVSIRGGEA